jgi:hypothetical protein
MPERSVMSDSAWHIFCPITAMSKTQGEQGIEALYVEVL